MDVSKNSGTPKSSIFMGFSMIFTIHFGGKIPLFLETPIKQDLSLRFRKDFSEISLAARAEGVGTMVLKCQEKMEAMEVPI